MGVENIELRLSGGSGNTLPASSTGGAMSSAAVMFQTATFTAIPGISVVNAAGHSIGNGTLAFTAASKQLTWIPPSGTIGYAVNVSASGTYLVRGGGLTSGYLIVTIVSGSLPAVDYTRTVSITNSVDQLLPLVDKDTALAGATQYYLYYVYNVSGTAVKSLSVALEIDTPGLDTLSIATISAVDTTELQAAASGHTYSAVGVPIAVGDVASGSYIGVWIKRVVPTGLIDAVTENTFRIRITTLS